MYLANISFIKNDDINKNNIKDTFFIYLKITKFKANINFSYIRFKSYKEKKKYMD